MHDSGVEYEKTVVMLTPELRARWRWTIFADGDAEGLCPACGGKAFGPEPPDLPDVTDGVDALDAEAPPERDHIWRCRCGHDHGNDDAKSCGRWGLIPRS